MKSPEELGITQQELDALLAVRSGLAAGLLEHTSYKKLKAKSDPKSLAFNMDIAYTKHDCGTVGCIGGWMGVFMHTHKLEADKEIDYNNVRHYVNNKRSYNLEELFFPLETHDGFTVDYDSISSAMALQAIDNFLANGEPDWKNVCGDLVTTYEPVDRTWDFGQSNSI
jgi:hypothetical protein